MDYRSASTNDIALCASCDRCRARKTKCDGNRPCGNCAAKYMKQHKLGSIEGVPMTEFDCIFSPAKRRGPVPGRSASRRSITSLHDFAKHQQPNNMPQANAEWGSRMSQQPLSANGGMMNGNVVHAVNSGSNMLIKQMQQRQQQHARPESLPEQGKAQRMRLDNNPAYEQRKGNIPRTLVMHAHLLEKTDPEGSRLFAYYKLSIDELFRLPPTPSDDEMCTRLHLPSLSMIPGPYLSALSAVRFAEVALGALVHNEVPLAMELCNAVVHCLRESVQGSVQPVAMYQVAKAYFLLGSFRAMRGDMTRYFKYRRVCISYLSKCSQDAETMSLMAAVSFLDSWAYMIYNADESSLPEMKGMPLVGGCVAPGGFTNETELKYGTRLDVQNIARDPRNKNWIQGPPPVYLNSEAPLPARALDALSCAVRSCCDQANARFAAINTEATAQDGEVNPVIREETIITPTATAVMAHETELCSRNMVLSAYALMQQYEGDKGRHKHEGQHLIISAMDAFLDNSAEDGSGGFSDSQIQSLLSVCNTAVENPFLLHHAGPTYHLVSNAAVLLCHLLNGMQQMKVNGQFGPVEATMFEEVMDTLLSVRKLMNVHRRKLPLKLRCHGIPRPELAAQPGKPVVDLGETMLCSCRGCQGFVLMACSPCVATERARTATSNLDMELSRRGTKSTEIGDLDRELEYLGNELNLDDDMLSGMIIGMISDDVLNTSM